MYAAVPRASLSHHVSDAGAKHALDRWAGARTARQVNGGVQVNHMAISSSVADRASIRTQCSDTPLGSSTRWDAYGAGWTGLRPVPTDRCSISFCRSFHGRFGNLHIRVAILKGDAVRALVRPTQRVVQSRVEIDTGLAMAVNPRT